MEIEVDEGKKNEEKVDEDRLKGEKDVVKGEKEMVSTEVTKNQDEDGVVISTASVSNVIPTISTQDITSIVVSIESTTISTATPELNQEVVVSTEAPVTNVVLKDVSTKELINVSTEDISITIPTRETPTAIFTEATITTTIPLATSTTVPTAVSTPVVDSSLDEQTIVAELLKIKRSKIIQQRKKEQEKRPKVKGIIIPSEDDRSRVVKGVDYIMDPSARFVVLPIIPPHTRQINRPRPQTYPTVKDKGKKVVVEEDKKSKKKEKKEVKFNELAALQLPSEELDVGDDPEIVREFHNKLQQEELDRITNLEK